MKKKTNCKPKTDEEKVKDERETTAQLLDTMNAFYRIEWPERLTMDTVWVCDLRQNGPDRVNFNVSFDGSQRSLRSWLTKTLKRTKFANN